MDVKDIPQWAWDEVDKRVPYRHATSAIEWAEYVDDMRVLAAGLISQYEKPPVDPLLIEAREIVAKFDLDIGYSDLSKEVLDGYHDKRDKVLITLADIKRGIEIGKKSK